MTTVVSPKEKGNRDMFDERTKAQIERLADRAVRAATEGDPDGPATAYRELTKTFRTYGDFGATLREAFLNEARSRASKRSR